MGYVVIKPVRDRDEYVIWSTFVDAPTAYGDREEILGYLAEPPYSSRPGDPPEERLARADANGSSMVPYPFGWWDDDEFIYEQRGLLPREHLVRACELLCEERDDEVLALLVPFEGEVSIRA